MDDRRQAELLLDRVLSARERSRTPFPPETPRVETANSGSSSNGGEGGGGACDSGGNSDSSSPGMLLDSGKGAAVAAEDEAGVSWRGRGPSASCSVGVTKDFYGLGMRLGIAGPPGAGKSSFIEVRQSIFLSLLSLSFFVVLQLHLWAM